MTTFFLRSAVAVFFCCMMNASFAQDYRTISGNYYSNGPSTIMCSCNSQGLLTYVASDGNSYTMTLCFDTEPGSFYEIFDGEYITVEGNVKNIPCANGQSYLVLYVQKSQMQIQNRRELIPEFIKKQPTSNATPPAAKEKVQETTLQGHYVPKGSTMDDWSALKNCKSCGRIGDNRNLNIIFDRISTAPQDWGNIKVWGTKEGNNFYVTKWQKQ